MYLSLIESLPIRKSAFLRISLFIVSFFYSTFAFPTEITSDEHYNFTIGANNPDTAASFSVPKNYNPDVKGGFFNVLVYYPSMTPALKPYRYTKTSKILDIVVMRYPPNGNEVDDLISGRWGAKKVGAENGFDLYSEPVGKNRSVQVFVFRSKTDNYVTVTDYGDWSVKYKMSFYKKGRYVVRCYFGKEIGSSFQQIHSVVVDFVEAHEARN